MTREEVISEAQSYLESPQKSPPNESCTCEWVILPLLWYAAGYARREIVSRSVDSNGKFPDYTLLPDHPTATWYLEAKAWNVTLEDSHAIQALNYANHNGKRFVVLTNGQVWRLYDNSIQGQVAAKQITETRLRDTTAILVFLSALCKSEILSGSMERFVAEEQARQQRERETENAERRQHELYKRLHVVLPEKFAEAQSELTLLLTAALRETPEFADLSPKTVALWFDELLSAPPELPISPSPESGALPEIPSVSVSSGQKTLTLTALKDLSLDGKNSRPVSLHCPDGKIVPVRAWVDCAEQAVRWLCTQSRPVPIPFEAVNRNRWFLNQSPTHKYQGQRCKFRAIHINGDTIYMDTDRSGANFVTAIHALCVAVQVAPGEFRITMIG